MQNKPNFQDAQMNVNSFITKDYRKKDDFAVQKNKPNSNPNKPNLLDAQMNITSVLTKHYENIANWTLGENKPNTNPTCRGVAPAASPPRRGEAGPNPISNGAPTRLKLTVLELDFNISTVLAIR